MGMVTEQLALREMQKLRPLDRDNVKADYRAIVDDLTLIRWLPIAFAFAHRHARIVVRDELRVVRLFTYSWADEKERGMTAREALAFIRKRGVVLESARGPVPSLAQVIAGETIRGSWWSHPKSPEIFAVTRAVRDSE
jgi:hypothetical protein